MITFIKRPERFTPAGNPVVFQIQSDNTAILNFRVSLIDSLTSNVIGEYKFSPTPRTAYGSHMDLSKILSNVVSWQVNNDSFNLIAPVDKPVRSYKLKITERVVGTGGTIVNGAEVTTDPYYVFYAELGRIAANNFSHIRYVQNLASLSTFLTNAPNYKKVNDLSCEFLYFLTDIPEFTFVKIRIYQGSTVKQIVTKTVPDAGNHKLYRINVSPKSLSDSSNVNWAGITHYTVTVCNSVGQPVTIERTYTYSEVDCTREHVNILWVNSLGGVDSFQFNTPADTISYSKFSMATNPWFVNGDGLYTDNQNGVYNPTDVVISNKPQTSTKVWSNELTDEDGFWLQELFASKQAWVELGDGSLCPIRIDQNSFTIPRISQLQGQFNQISLDYTLSSGIIPVGTNAYSNGAGKVGLQFIDNQLNTIPDADTDGWGIIVDPSDSVNRQYNPADYDSHDYA